MRKLAARSVSINGDMAVITKPATSGLGRRTVIFWIGLLSLAQIADLVTTQVDMAQGGVEANLIAAQLMAIGGLGLLTVVKISLVIAMAMAVLLIDRQDSRTGERVGSMAHTLIWRGVQVCVVALAATALHNVAVLAQLQS